MGMVCRVGVIPRDLAPRIKGLGESRPRCIERGNGAVRLPQKAVSPPRVEGIPCDLALRINSFGERIDSTRHIERGNGSVGEPQETMSMERYPVGVVPRDLALRINVLGDRVTM